MSRILIPLPDHDFDTTEVSVPWKILSSMGHEVMFATENADRPACDPLLLQGVLFGKLGAEPQPKKFYGELESDSKFEKPIAWASIEPKDFDALILPGGHAPGMRQYLGSDVLQGKISSFWRLERPVAAICHGVLVLARSKDEGTGKSVLAQSKTTCLPKYMERTAYFLTAWKLGKYYRTYPEYVEDEVKAALADPSLQFVLGPKNLTTKGTAEDDTAAFVVEDGRYLSARWPGDAYLFAKKIAARLS
ncbi:MAG: type 1 glutamine amidotransferase domain-containing protein [Polyangiaceae bacterium]